MIKSRIVHQLKLLKQKIKNLLHFKVKLKKKLIINYVNMLKR